MSCKIITVAQQKGGSGKTTIAAHIAVALGQKNYKVALIDTDPQATLKCWYGLREERFGKEYTGMEFVSVSGIRIANELLRLKSKVDFIVIDSPPHTATETKSSVRNSDIVIIPIQPSPADLWAASATINICGEERIKFFTLLNRVNKNTKLASDIRSKVLNPLKSEIANRTIFASCFLKGLCATEVGPKDSASIEVKKLVDEILKKLR